MLFRKGCSLPNVIPPIMLFVLLPKSKLHHMPNGPPLFYRQLSEKILKRGNLFKLMGSNRTEIQNPGYLGRESKVL